MKSSLALAMLFRFFLLAAEPAFAALDRTLFDFESGTYAGWKVEGPAFGDAPFAVAKAQEWREDRRPFGMQGRFFVKTGETRHETTPDSTLTSDEFEITRDYLKFLLAGEVHPRVRVVLRVRGREARVAYGNNAYDLRLRGWDVREFQGRTARLVIEEAANADSLMGNNNASRFHFRHLFRSDQPFRWELALEYGPLKGLFLEGGHSVVRDEKGDWFITHDGVYAGGVWLAPLRWNDGLTDPGVTLPPGAIQK